MAKEYKPGDKATVIACTSNHGFDIGETITIIGACSTGYWARGTKNNLTWFVYPSEIKPLEK